jgi:hypothetical protein
MHLRATMRANTAVPVSLSLSRCYGAPNLRQQPERRCSPSVFGVPRYVQDGIFGVKLALAKDDPSSITGIFRRRRPLFRC